MIEGESTHHATKIELCHAITTKKWVNSVSIPSCSVSEVGERTGDMAVAPLLAAPASPLASASISEESPAGPGE